MVEIMLYIDLLSYFVLYRTGIEHIEKLPSSVQLELASLLLSAVVIDYDTKSNGALSFLLLNSVMATFRTVHRELQAENANRYVRWSINI